MSDGFEKIKDALEITKPMWEPFLSAALQPYVAKLSKMINREGEENKESSCVNEDWEDRINTYLRNIHKHCSYVPTLVFPNRETLLKELYVPLTLVDTRESKECIIDNDVKKLFDEYRNVIIVDQAGMGKSTLTKWIILNLIENQNGIPILVELRKVNSSNSILNEILHQLQSIDKSLNDGLVIDLLDLGLFSIFMDGYDEITYKDQQEVTSQIVDFIKKAGNNDFIITSRPESALSTFANFQLFTIKPLNHLESYELIKKLDKISKGKIAGPLIKEISINYTQIKEFLVNPLLVSLLYRTYTFNKDIPSKKTVFYDEVYTSLYKFHDLTKESFKRVKNSGLDIRDFETILKDIAFNTSKIGQVEYTRIEMMDYITRAKGTNNSISFSESAFYDDLTTTVPLFIKVGVKIKWAHKSLQDYFAAAYISSHNQRERILEVILNSEKFGYLNILSLLSELHPKVFRKVITKGILEDFIYFFEGVYREKEGVNSSDIKRRIGLLYGDRIFIKGNLKLFSSNYNKDVNQEMRNHEPNISIVVHYSDRYALGTCNFFKKRVVSMLKKNRVDVFFKESRYENSVCRKLALVLKQDEIYEINATSEEIYNNPKNYRITNYIIERFYDRDAGNSMQNDKSLSLSIGKCRKELEAINQEIENENSKEFFW